MEASRFDALSPRQRDCLRLVFEHRTSKEIAIALGVEKSTVDGYVAEAVRTIGARDRRDAARMLAAHEGAPSRIGGDPARVDAPARAPAASLPADEPIDWRSLLPIRRKGARYNDLSGTARLAWIAILAVAMLVAFGQLTSGLKVLAELTRSFGGR